MIDRQKKGHRKRLSPPSNNLPYETIWLLEFINLGRKEGGLCPPDYALDKLKRKPDPSQADELTTSFFSFTGFTGIDEDNNIWITSEASSDGRPFSIRVKGFPVEEFKKLLIEKKIPYKHYIDFSPGEAKNCDTEDYDICELLKLWVDIKKSFYWIAKENLSGKHSHYPDFLSRYLFYFPPLFDQFIHESELTYDYSFGYNLTRAIAVCFFNFYYRQEELRDRLRCCYCCGRFFIPQRRRKFCSLQCKTKFHRLPKEKKAELEKLYRRHKKENQQKREYKELVELLKKYKDCSDSEAKKEAHEWIFEKGKSLTSHGF
jgi:hypothetical protein